MGDLLLVAPRLLSIGRFPQNALYRRAKPRNGKPRRRHDFRHPEPFKPTGNTRLIVGDRNGNHWHALAQGLSVNICSSKTKRAYSDYRNRESSFLLALANA